MNKNTLHDSETYKLISIGNGWAYEVVNKKENKSFWAQDDDAGTLEKEIDAIGAMGWDYEKGCAYLWDIYSSIATPLIPANHE